MNNYSFRPTNIALVLIFLLLAFFMAATNIQAGWLYAFDSIILSLLVFSIFNAFFSINKIKISRHHSPYIYANDNISITLSIFNPTKRVITFLEINDNTPLKIGAYGNIPVNTTINSKLFPEIPSKNKVDFTYTIQSLKRGIYKFNSVMVNSHDYFGLFHVKKIINLPSVFKVYPVVPPLTEIPEALIHKANTNKYHRSIRGDMLSNLREYVPGDSTNLIHWRTTARYQKLMVKEAEEEEHRQVIILIDLSYSDEYLEDIIKKAGSIAQYCLNNGNPVKLFCSKILIPAEFIPVTKNMKDYSKAWEIEALNWHLVLEWLTILDKTEIKIDDIINDIDKRDAVLIKLP